MRKNLFSKIVSLLLVSLLLMPCMVFESFAQVSIPGLYAGDSLAELSYSTSGSTNIVLADNVYGKSAGDSVYAFVTADPAATADSATIQPLPVNNEHKPLVYEFQFMLPKGSNGFNVYMQFWPVSGSTDQNVMKITPDGINPGGHTDESNSVIDGTSFEYNKWYTAAFVFPGASGDATYGTHLGIYINGVQKANVPYGGGTNNYNKSKGLRRFRMSPISGTAETVYVYMDNLRMTDSVYNSSMDTAPAISVANTDNVYSIEDNVINFAAGTTVAQLGESLDKLSDTVLRVYNNKGVLQSQSAPLPHEGTVVVAACNSTGVERTYSYYTLSEAKSDVYIYGDLDFSDISPKLVLDIQTKNTSGGTVWLAIYTDGCLEKLLAKKCAAGISENDLGLSVDKDTFVNNYEIKCFAWDKNDIPISVATNIKMSDKLILADYTTPSGCNVDGCEYSENYKLFGKGALKYTIDNIDEADLTIPISTKDWAGYNTLNIEMYSAKNIGQSMHFAAKSENSETEGDDYFNFYPVVDWDGYWTTASFSFDYNNPLQSYGFTYARNPVGFNKIDKLALWAAYSSSETLSYDTEVYISRIYLTNETKLYKGSVKNFNYYPFSELIKSYSNGAHPRIVTDADNLQTNVNLVANGQSEFLVNTADEVIKLADEALTTPDSEYSLFNGVQLVRTEREMIRNLSVAYVLTGNEEYYNRCLRALSVMASWPDWNPSQALDVAEAAYSFALAYDLLYDKLGDNRKMVEDALMTHAIKPSLAIWEDDRDVAAQTDNWQCVCSGGVGMAALAICDSVSEEDSFICNQFISHAIRTLPRGIKGFAPDGAYTEGLGYWGYATEYLFGFISTLQNSVGNTYNLTEFSGLEQTGYFPISALGPAGNFNFYDSEYSATTNSRVAQMFTIAYIYNQPNLASYAANTDLYGDYLDIISYRHELVQAGGDYKHSLSKDYMFRGDQNLVYSRSSWDDNATYIAYKGGKNNATAHGDLDIGQFVMDSQGERWFHDLGAEDYQADGVWSTKEPTESRITRWSYYRKRAEGHNTLVINPAYSADQQIKATANIETFVSGEDGSYGIINMTQAYSNNASSVKRGIALINNRQDVVIQDEIIADGTLKDVYSFFHTKADITIDDKNPSVAYLEQNGKKIRVDIVSGNATWGQMNAEALVIPKPQDSRSNHLYKKLFIHLEDTVNPTITIVIRNIYDNTDDVDATFEQIPLENWGDLF